MENLESVGFWVIRRGYAQCQKWELIVEFPCLGYPVFIILVLFPFLRFALMELFI